MAHRFLTILTGPNLLGQVQGSSREPNRRNLDSALLSCGRGATAARRARLWGKRTRSLSPLTGGFSCASPARRRRALTAPSGGHCRSITSPNTLPDIVLLFPPISPVNSREKRAIYRLTRALSVSSSLDRESTNNGDGPDARGSRTDR